MGKGASGWNAPQVIATDSCVNAAADQAVARAFTRADRREILRAAVFL